MNNAPRKLLAAFFPLLLLAAAVAIAACGGGDDDDDGGQVGNLTNPDNVPTATPWEEAPEVVILDPNNIEPLPPDSPGGDDNDGDNGEPTVTPEPGEPGVCGETYTVEAGDTMFGIAAKCDVDSQLLIEANPDVDPGSLNIGDVIILPESPVSPDDGEAADEGE